MTDSRKPRQKPRRLTPAQVAEKCQRDEAILALVLRDVSERRIALQLKVSRNTVRRVRERYITGRVAELESTGSRIRAMHVGRYAVLHERAHQFLAANPSDARGLQATRDILDSMGRLLGLDAPSTTPVVTVNNTSGTTIDLSKLTDQQLESLAVIMGLTPDPSLGQPTRSLELSAEGLNVVERGADATSRMVEQRRGRRAGFEPAPEPEAAGPSPEPASEGSAGASGGPAEPLTAASPAQPLPEPPEGPSAAPSEPQRGGPEPGPGGASERLAQSESGAARAEPTMRKYGEFSRFFGETS